MGVFSRGARRWGVIGSRARAFQPDADEPLFSIPAATRAGSTGDGPRALVSWRVVARVPTSGERTAERSSTDFMCVCVPQAFLVIGTLYREAALRECFSEADQSFITGVLGPYDSRVGGTGGAKAVFSALNMLAQVFQPTRVTAALRTAAKTAASSAAIASAAGGAAAGGGGGVVPPLRRRLCFPFVSSRRARHHGFNEKRRRLYRFCGLLRARVASWRLGDSREDQKAKWQGHFGVKLLVVKRGKTSMLRGRREQCKGNRPSFLLKFAFVGRLRVFFVLKGRRLGARARARARARGGLNVHPAERSFPSLGCFRLQLNRFFARTQLNLADFPPARGRAGRNRAAETPTF